MELQKKVEKKKKISNCNISGCIHTFLKSAPTNPVFIVETTLVILGHVGFLSKLN
jgi:hypothetical protein